MTVPLVRLQTTSAAGDFISDHLLGASVTICFDFLLGYAVALNL